jgi:hypothetical protein
LYLRWRRRAQHVRRNKIFSDLNNPYHYLDETDIVGKHRLSRPLILRVVPDHELCPLIMYEMMFSFVK